MKAIIYSLLLLSLQIISCNQKQIEVKDLSITEVDSMEEVLHPPPPVKVSEFLITDTSFGEITSSTNLEQLKKLFGDKNISDTIEYGAEGQDSFKVTRVFENTPNEITIEWKENKLHKKISSVECIAINSPYHTAQGLAVNKSTLQDLLAANGKPINFYGTGWDYGGIITSYNKGKFQNSKLSFYLTDLPGMNEKLAGDKELNTNMPLVKSNITKIGITKIALSFGGPKK